MFNILATVSSCGKPRKIGTLFTLSKSRKGSMKYTYYMITDLAEHFDFDLICTVFSTNFKVKLSYFSVMAFL